MNQFDFFEDDKFQGSANDLRKLQYESAVRQLNETPLESLFQDVIERELKVSLIDFIEMKCYERAKDEASICINTLYPCRQKHPKAPQIRNWVLGVIQCFTHILIWHIKDKLNEEIIERNLDGISIPADRRPFWHFQNKDTSYQKTIGAQLNEMYNRRNDTIHPRDEKTLRWQSGRYFQQQLKQAITAAKMVIEAYEKEVQSIESS